MQVILTIDDELLSKMQMHANITQENLNEMLSNLFVKFIAEPGQLINEEVSRDHCGEFEAFQKMFFKWFSSMAYAPHNIALHKVLMRLRDEHLQNLHVLTDLYRTYRNQISLIEEQ